MKKIPSILVSASLFIAMIVNVYAQDQGMMKEEMIRFHTEGIAMNQTEIILQNYHDEVGIYKFPSQELALGKAAAEKYWNVQTKSGVDRAIEILEMLDTEVYSIIRFREVDPELMIPKMKAMILEFKESKIYRVYLLD